MFLIRRLGAVAFVFFIATQLEAATICVTPATGCGTIQSTVQAAVNAAAAGDTIILHAGTTYTEAVVLPNKGVLASFITITTDAAAGSLPAAGVRTGPSFAAFLPKLKSPNGGASAVATAAGANHYKFQHIEGLFVPGGFRSIFQLGAADSTQVFESQEPSDIIIDQCYIHGDPVTGQKNGIEMHAKNVTITNSDIRDIGGVGQEAHGLVAINGHGPFDIENNYIEAAGINILIGGGDPTMRTYMRVTGSATTTGAAVQTYETGHTLAELRVGQLVAILTGAGTTVEYTTLTGISGTGATGTLTWSPAISVAPDNPGDIRAGTVAGAFSPAGQGVIVRRNLIEKNPARMNGVLATPASPSATPLTGTGTLAANTYFYKVQAFSTTGYQNSIVNGATSAEVTATLSATGQVTVAWTAVTGATIYRVWRGTAAGGENQYTTSTTTSLIDEGTKAYTVGTPGGATVWVVKNLLEFKAAQNVQVDSNIFQNHWRGSDVGYAWWIKSVNQDGGCWFCQSKNLVYEKNILHTIFSWVELHGQEKFSPNFNPPPLTNVTLRNNLIYDNSSAYGKTLATDTPTTQYTILILDSVTNLTIDHNTVVQTGGKGLIVTDGPPQASTNPGLIIRNNMLRAETFGIHASSASHAGALAACCPSFIFTNNDVADAISSQWPAGNTYEVASAWENQFVTFVASGAGADFHIKLTSPLHLAGTDAKDVGADIDLVNAATSGVTTGGGGTAPSITTSALPNGVRTIAYSNTIGVSGGTPPNTFTVTAGTLPAGVTLASSTGVLSGTPTTAATYTFTITVTDSTAKTAAQAYTVTIVNPLTITTLSPLPAATLNVSYPTQTITSTGGQEPSTCSLTAGSLPAGLSLNASACTISGTPTATGASSFTVRKDGALGSFDSKAFTLTVANEALPCNRVPKAGPGGVPIMGAVFRQSTAPTLGDCAANGDFWINTATQPAIINSASVTNGILAWTPLTPGLSISSDGARLTNLNASELKTGAVSNAVLPSSLSVASDIGSPTFSATQFYDVFESECGSLAAAGHSRLCMDNATHTLKLSENGGAYGALGGGASGAGSMSIGGNIMSGLLETFGTKDCSASQWNTNNGNRASILCNGDTTFNTNNGIDLALNLSTNNSADTYGLGVATGRSRKATFTSLQGAQQQVLIFADTANPTDYSFVHGSSQDTGATWRRWFGVRQDGYTAIAVPGTDGTAPTVAGCGTTPTIVGGALDFQITIGATPGTCVATFQGVTLVNAPMCTFSNSTGGAIGGTSTTTTATVAGTIASGNLVTVHCVAR